VHVPEPGAAPSNLSFVMYRSYGDAVAGSRGYGTGKPAASGAPNRQSVPSSPLKPRPGLGSEFGSAYGAFDDRYHRKQSSSMSMAPDRRSVVTNVREEDVTRGSGNSGARGDVRVPKFDFSNLPKSDPPSSGMSSLPSPRTGESSQSPRQPAAASRCVACQCVPGGLSLYVYVLFL
jgi:hypothetical protein